MKNIVKLLCVALFVSVISANASNTVCNVEGSSNNNVATLNDAYVQSGSSTSGKCGFKTSISLLKKSIGKTHVIIEIFNDYGQHVANYNATLYDGESYTSVFIDVDKYSGPCGNYRLSLVKAVCEEQSITVTPKSSTTISKYAFCKRQDLEHFTIPNSVTSIEEGAFKDCKNLTSITIPNSVTYIGKYAFKGCTNLKSITLPNSIKIIGMETFAECENLINIVIPNSVEIIEKGAFANCKNLRTITIPNSVVSIESGVFAWCENLRNVVLPSSINTIEEETFFRCTNLKSITLF